MNNLDKLISYFEQFPGIGARQARRFAFHILTLPKKDVQQFSQLIASLQDSVAACSSCQRFFSHNGGSSTLCNICSDDNRDRRTLMVVERDSDIQAIERGGMYEGLYFVLGGTIPLLNTKDNLTLRSGTLKGVVEQRIATEELSEIILAFSVNPDGENTGRYVESLLKDAISQHQLKITQLGRGLSTGSELEYADPQTIKNAFQNRG